MHFDEVMGRITRVPGVAYTVLVPNLRGAERALESREQSFTALAAVGRHVAGRTATNVSLSTSFGCPMEDEVPQAVVHQFKQRFADLGVRSLTMCETPTCTPRPPLCLTLDCFEGGILSGSALG